MQLTEHAVQVEGIRLHWSEIGPESEATPVVLLHGLNNSSRSWSYVAPLLAKDRRVLMLDLPGHGESARPNVGYALDWYAHIVALWLQSVGLERCDVIGHSFGGGVAQMLLLECPERIRRLVLVAAGGLGKEVGFWLRLASLPLVVEHFGQPFMALGTQLAFLSIRHSVPRADIAQLGKFNAQSGSARAFARTVRDVVNLRGQRRNFFKRVSEVKQLPAVLVVWGDRDKLIPIEQGRAFSTMLQGSVFKAFEGAGHYLHNEQPEAFARVVRAFLDDPTVRAAHIGAPSSRDFSADIDTQ